MREALSTEQNWQRFAESLAECLGALEEDEYLIITSKRTGRFVQFAAQGDVGMRMEAVSNAFIQDPDLQLSDRDLLIMGEFGWHTPTGSPEFSTPENDPDGSPNFFLDVAQPVDYGASAAMAIQTLRTVYKVKHPGMLVYKAFSFDGADLRFPTLHLKRDET